MDAWSATLRGDAARLEELLRLDLHSLDELHPVTGQTVLHLACAQHKEDIVGLLLRKGADPDIADAVLGETALHKAAARGLARVVQMLVTVNADQGKFNRRGQRASDLAQNSGDRLTIDLLTDSNANRARARGQYRVADALEESEATFATDEEDEETKNELTEVRLLERKYRMVCRSDKQRRASVVSLEAEMSQKEDEIYRLRQAVDCLQKDLVRETQQAQNNEEKLKDYYSLQQETKRLDYENSRLKRMLETERARREEDKKIWLREQDKLEDKLKKQYDLNLELQRSLVQQRISVNTEP